MDDELQLQVDLLHVKTPSNVPIADSVKCVQMVKEHVATQLPIKKFKPVQSKVY